MAVPKRKSSQSRRNKRRNQSWTLSAPNLAKCSKCGELLMPHRACKACGTYKNKEVVAVK